MKHKGQKLRSFGCVQNAVVCVQNEVGGVVGSGTITANGGAWRLGGFASTNAQFITKVH